MLKISSIMLTAQAHQNTPLPHLLLALVVSSMTKLAIVSSNSKTASNIAMSCYPVFWID